VITSVFHHETQNQKIETFPVTVIPQENIQDLNGAGDAFVGGFLAQVALGSDIAKCVEAGLYLSGDIIQRPGTSFPEPCGYE